MTPCCGRGAGAILTENKRVSATPTTVPKLIALGYDVVVEEGAGDESSFPNAKYAGSGAVIVLEASRYGRIISFAMTQSKGAQDG